MAWLKEYLQERVADFMTVTYAGPMEGFRTKRSKFVDIVSDVEGILNKKVSKVIASTSKGNNNTKNWNIAIFPGSGTRPDIVIEHTNYHASSSVVINADWKKMSLARFSDLSPTEQLEFLTTKAPIKPLSWANYLSPQLLGRVIETLVAEGRTKELKAYLKKATFKEALTQDETTREYKMGATGLLLLLKNHMDISELEAAFRETQVGILRALLLKNPDDYTKEDGVHVADMRTLGYDWPEIAQLEMLLMFTGNMRAVA